MTRDIVDGLHRAAAPVTGPLSTRFPENDALRSEAAATITALRARVVELEGALEPFASAGGTPMFGDEEQVPLNFKGKHFRRARNALSATAPDAESSQNGADSAALRAKGGEHG